MIEEWLEALAKMGYQWKLTNYGLGAGMLFTIYTPQGRISIEGPTIQSVIQEALAALNKQHARCA